MAWRSEQGMYVCMDIQDSDLLLYIVDGRGKGREGEGLKRFRGGEGDMHACM